MNRRYNLRRYCNCRNQIAEQQIEEQNEVERNDPDDQLQQQQLIDNIQEEEAEEELNEEIEIQPEMEGLADALLALANRPVNEVQPPSFSGKSTEDIREWINKFDMIAAHNRWDEEKVLRALPLYLKDGALTYYQGFTTSY